MLFGTMPGCPRTGEWLPKTHPLHPASSELEDPGEAPGNLAKIIILQLTFLNSPSVYQVISVTKRPRAVAPGLGDRAWPGWG